MHAGKSPRLGLFVRLVLSAGAAGLTGCAGAEEFRAAAGASLETGLNAIADGILAGAFAVFHGYAHTVEMPIGASALEYALGFIAGTVILHGAGLGAGLALNRVMPVRRTA